MARDRALEERTRQARRRARQHRWKFVWWLDSVKATWIILWDRRERRARREYPFRCRVFGHDVVSHPAVDPGLLPDQMNYMVDRCARTGCYWWAD
jgi:hypothetical protein